MVAEQLQRLDRGRETLAHALEADIAGINGLLDSHVEKFADGRAGLTKALEDDLDKLAQSRMSIDGLVAGQVEKLAEGRDILKRALEVRYQQDRGRPRGACPCAAGRPRQAGRDPRQHRQ